jgi:DNA-binding CsgD family transcriptional regulator
VASSWRHRGVGGLPIYDGRAVEGLARNATTGDAAFGRSSELLKVQALLEDEPAAATALAITGIAGIGKTTVWREGVRVAHALGYTVLSARPTGSETGLSFGGLADLLQDVPDHIFDTLPAVQREGLDVALLRREAALPGQDGRVVATALLSVLRALAGTERVLLAVDDAQALDAATFEALSFAVRRLEDLPVRVLVSVRTDGSRPSTFDQSLPIERRHDLGLGPMSTAALHDVIQRELGRSLARPLVVQIAAKSGGSPMYAVEIARELERTGVPLPGAPLPVPDELRTLIRARVARLPAATRDALLLAASMSQPIVPIVDADALAPAEDDGVVVIDEAGRIAFTHPLLSAAVYESATSAKRRATHRYLAEKVGDGEERARHLGLAAQGPDETVAEALDRAAQHAAARGATAAACQLGRRALDLTEDPRGTQAAARTLTLATNLSVTGQTHEAKELLEATLTFGLSGDLLARALLHLAYILWYERAFAGGYARVMEALDVAQDPILIARIHNQAAWISEQINIDQAIRHADAVIDLLEPAPGPYTFALFYRSYLRLIDGQGADRASFERAMSMGMPTDQVDVSPVPFSWHTFLDEFDVAREVLVAAIARASALGDELSVQAFLCQLVTIECWTGNWAQADKLATQVMELTDRIESPAYLNSALFARGYVDAHMGKAEEARSAGLRILELLDDETGGQSVLGHWLLGFTALVEQDHVSADHELSRAAELVDRTGVRDPVRMRFQPDLVEAAIGCGNLDRAEALIARLEQRGRAFPRPWILATTDRCRGLLLAARGDLDGANAAMRSALSHHAGLEMPFERARTLLAMGQVLRRRREKREARLVLEEARSEFERLGARAWTARAVAELARIPLRQSSLALSATEAEIARLAAQGMTNKQIADRAFVSPKTVEANMARIYGKLGIRTRAELGRAMADLERPTET